MRFLFQPTILLAMALMAIIIMMVLPVPTFILDLGLACSFALAVLIFTLTLFIERPLDFSSFPTVLLGSLMLRLSLNVSSTKLIIGQGHTGTDAAGFVIEGFASFIMNGNVFLGLVVFCVLLIVNFMVITKGATRMAEVGARFALDAMPGKQLAIDADMSSGAISHEEARERRDKEQQETTFFGSLDGASKFVKGDAIAGLLITLLNLLMGLGMGTLVHGMPVLEAAETYAILTVGDGLVTQIPAVVISIASALLLSRGGTVGSTDRNLMDQLGRYPNAIAAVAVLMAIFAVVPGLPFIPFLIGASGLGVTAYFAHIKREDSPEPRPPQPEQEARKDTIGDMLQVDDVHVEFSPDLVPMALDPGTGLDARITNIRHHIAKTFGVILPEIRLTDESNLPAGTYAIRIHGVEAVRANLRSDKLLALPQAQAGDLPFGDDTLEPVYNAPARWVDQNEGEQASLAGHTVVAPSEVLATHLIETLKRNLGRLMTHKTLLRMLEESKDLSDPVRSQANQKFLAEMIPDRVSMDLLKSVLQLLLDEQVSVRNLPLIIEAIAEAKGMSSNPIAICEHVRQKIGFQIIAELRDADGSIALLQLDPNWEEIFTNFQLDQDIQGNEVALPPDMFNRLAEAIGIQLAEANNQSVFPALATSTRRRRFLQTVVRAKNLSLPVLSFEEIGLEARPKLTGVVPV